MLSGGARPGWGPRTPLPWSRCPRCLARGPPSPRPVRDMPYAPLFLRGNAFLSRSKPAACSLVPRGPLWVSSARSPRIPASPFPMHPRFARRSHRWSFTRCASLTPAVRFFFSYRTELTHRQLNHSILSKNSTIYLTSRKWSFILIPCINHI